MEAVRKFLIASGIPAEKIDPAGVAGFNAFLILGIFAELETPALTVKAIDKLLTSHVATPAVPPAA